MLRDECLDSLTLRPATIGYKFARLSDKGDTKEPKMSVKMLSLDKILILVQFKL